MSMESTLQELDAEIAALETRLAVTAVSHPDRVHTLDHQSALYHMKYRKTGEPKYIEEAIRSSQAAIEAMNFETPELYDVGAIWGNLSSWLSLAFGETGRIDDIKLAIEVGESALEYLPDHTKDWCTAVENLSVAWFRKATNTSNIETINEAVEKQEELLSLTSEGEKARSHILSNIGNSLATRYMQTKQLSDLEQAIKYGYQAVEEINDETDQNMVYNNLSSHLFNHYQATGISRSLDEAILASSINLSSPPANLQVRVKYMCNYGVFLHQKCLRFKDSKPSESLEMLELAIKSGKDAFRLLEECPPLAYKDHRSNLLNMLGAWLGTKLKMTNETDCGREGAEFLRRSLELMPLAHPERPRALRNLAHLHEVQFQILQRKGSQKQALEQLEIAIQYGKDILNTIPEDHPEIGEHYKNLAVMLASKDEILDDEETYLLAKKYLILAAGTENAPPLVRISAGIQAGLYRWFDKAYLEAHQHLQAAVEVLPRLNPREMSTADLQLALREVSGLASTATALALAAGRPSVEALQSLEAAHGLISGLFMSSKSDISRLKERDPELALNYEHIRAQVSKLAREQSQSDLSSSTRQSRQSLLKQLAEKEAEIRKLTGFERFQESLEEGDFKALACDGPVITINVARNRSDAIIVTEKDIHTISLPDCTYKILEDKLALFGDLGNENRRDAVPRRKLVAKETPSEALMWLWKTAVKPVLDATELKSSRRVWWITTGLAGRAPLHAAGNHSPASTDNTQSRVVSSYISSFKALRYARERAALKIPKPKMLLVTMKSNPLPHKDLDTSHEEKVVHEVFGESLTHLEQADPALVLEKLPHHSFVHFACHGFSSVNNPAQNGLLLVKTGQAAILSISDLEAVDLKAGAVAYLSACSTAEQSDLKLMDEAIHLANSFQALGFQHVIGTLWGADDTAAGEVARRFYKKLRVDEDRESQAIGFEVGLALHEAMMDYKMTLSGTVDVLKWAPFIHIGV